MLVWLPKCVCVHGYVCVNGTAHEWMSIMGSFLCVGASSVRVGLYMNGFIAALEQNRSTAHCATSPCFPVENIPVFEADRASHH